MTDKRIADSYSSELQGHIAEYKAAMLKCEEIEELIVSGMQRENVCFHTLNVANVNVVFDSMMARAEFVKECMKIARGKPPEITYGTLSPEDADMTKLIWIVDGKQKAAIDRVKWEFDPVWLNEVSYASEKWEKEYRFAFRTPGALNAFFNDIIDLFGGGESAQWNTIFAHVRMITDDIKMLDITSGGRNAVLETDLERFEMTRDELIKQMRTLLPVTETEIKK
jgi:hypothetical protein